MASRHRSGAMAVVLCACGLIAIAATNARSQQVPALPEKGTEPFTMTGCFMTERIEGHEVYVLRRPTVGSVRTVSEPTCTATTVNDERIRLRDIHDQPHKHHLDKSMIGRWVEVTGRLSAAGVSDYGLRDLHVRSFRVVPVVVPKAAEAAPSWPAVPPPPEIAAAPLDALPLPVGTAGLAELPKTASSLPLTALLGFAALAGGLTIRVFTCRRAAARSRCDC